jgi:prephenate dehydrogenase
MPSASVIGTGLIGASLGLALKEQGWTVVGWDPSPEALRVATERGAIDRKAASAGESSSAADLVVLAGPLQANIATLRSIRTDALVTDVTSVKSPFVGMAPKGVRFVGGHPMAGREHAGPGAASAGLFRGAPWVVCNDDADPSDVDHLVEVLETIGANPVVMSSMDHDRVVASISHLPLLLAVALVNGIADDPQTAELVSGSFRDLTRVASSESSWWPEVLAANAKPVSDALDSLIEHLNRIRGEIARSATEDLQVELGRAREHRSHMAPPLTLVRVILQDRPGEIAAVGHALETSRVDVRDLQLRHAVHGGGGVLTLAVRPGEAETLKTALFDEGFQLEPDD